MQQFLILKLQRPSIVQKIKFGKYEKPHVCNLRKFRIFGGTEESCSFLLLEAGLKNDSTPETFELKHRTVSGELLPVRFIKIMPLLSWGPCFNFSIWYVEVLGIDDAICVSSSLKSYTIEREAEIIRLCLKYFRQQGYNQAFQALQEQTNVQLEHPRCKHLHDDLVVEGDFKKTEQHIEQMIQEGLMDDWLLNQPYSVTWKQIEVKGVRPGKRGGHQLVLDPINRLVYLYGGWNGTEDLSDMWVYDLKTSQWSLIHERSELIGGPSPRACHKMVFDPNNSQIFMLGKYIDTSSRVKDKLKSDFFLYDTNTRTWLLICDSTADVGGPKLIYDHQMCIDATRRTIFVFGGRILSQDDISSEQNYSGLYAYHISDNVWNLLLIDCGHPSASNPEVNSIKSRVTHSMLFHDKNRKLYIFGGQRGKEYMTDFLTYDVESQEVTNLITAENIDIKNIPQSGMTQRATIDVDRNEIYVLTSLSKEKERRETNLSIWMYSLTRNEWSCVYRSDGNVTKNDQAECPCPRYAHQLVLDPIEKVHYLFGGNPGVQSHERLDDFWILTLQKPGRANVLTKTRYLIRTLEYEELTKKDPVTGLQYLQTHLSQVIDKSNEAQLKEFHKLATLLFKPQETTSPSCSDSASPYFDESSKESMESVAASDDLFAYNIDQVTQISNRQSDEIQRNRYVLYNKLIEFLPEKLCQPKANLNDFVLI